MNTNKLIDQFGSKPISQELIERIKKVCNVDDVHPFIKRGIVCSHRDLDEALDNIEQGRGVYLYTGRGPSTNSLHFGHLIPFMITKYLQDLFKCPLFIQITDDEKFLIKGEYTLTKYREMAENNISDISLFDFDPSLSHLFS